MSERRSRFGWLAAAAVVGMLPCAVSAAGFADAFRDALYGGDIGAAADLARAEADAGAGDGTAQFALGVAGFLGAVEGLGAALHRYGLYNGSEGFGPLDMAGLPFLRLPIATNPTPDPVFYRALRQTLEGFDDGLAAAATALAGVGDRMVDLELDLARIRLDLDEDGVGRPGESLLDIFGAVSGMQAGEALVVDFDSADAVWLLAYSSVLMALSDVLLAHDWEAAYLGTFEGLFPQSFTPKTPLHDLTRDAPQRMEELQRRLPDVPDCDQWADDARKAADCQAAWLRYRQDDAVRDMQTLATAVQFGSIADMVAFVHLTRWPVVEPERMASALGHLEAMVSLSRENWRRILAETDSGREWIPSPTQSGAIPNMRIGQDLVDGWLGFLDRFDAVLKGETMLPHWRFARGFNLRRMFLEPSTFDIVLLLQGSAIVPYLDDGPVADAATWARATQVFGGDFFRYAVWIN